MLLVAAFAAGGCAHGHQIESLGREVAAIQAEDLRRDQEVTALTEQLEQTRAELEAAHERIRVLEAQRDELLASLSDDRERAERLQWRVSRIEHGHRTWRDHSSGRLVRLERQLGLQPPVTPKDAESAPKPTADLLPVDLPADPTKHVPIARKHLARGDNGVARAIVSHALELTEDDALASELRYLLGMTWFQEERWGQAATTFQLVTETHPDSVWAAWSLLRQGECFREMGDIGTARVFFEELTERFAETEAAAEAERLLAVLPPTTL